MKVREITEFEDVQDELAAMSVAEIVIQSIVDETRDPSIAWQSLVILATPDARFFTPWVLAVRPSESDARRAVVELLRGLVEARRAAQQSAPAVDGWNAVVTTQRAMRAVDAWRQHRGDDAAPAAAEVRPVHPLVDETPMEPPPVPRYDEPDYARWRAEVRATREQRGLTQVELAREAGTTPSHISRIERDVRRPPLALAQAISDALDLRPPPVAEASGGAHGADPGAGVLRHSGSNGAVATKQD